MLLGSGELGKEVAISAKRLGCKVIACDRYLNAPAMQVSDINEVLDMTNPNLLKKVIYKHKPDIIIPEIEALAVSSLEEVEEKGITVIPNAKATAITMNRDKIRDLASKVLNLKTANFTYASSIEELKDAVREIGLPVIIKPIMSSSGKGQSLIEEEKDIAKGWQLAMEGARGKSKQVIVEEFLKFDLEITLLTIRQNNGPTLFCPPIGHKQSGGDYQCSWQPAKLTHHQLKEAQSIAKTITDHLGGVGLFGVEFFINGDDVIFSELSPRPHDTGLVTLISQNLNEFELHLHAVLGLPIPDIKVNQPAASRVILSTSVCSKIAYTGVEEALAEPDTRLLLFGKPNSKKGRRMGVALASDENLSMAQSKADRAASCIQISEQ